jgi:hypothetical protein
LNTGKDGYMTEHMERAGIILPSMMLDALAAGQVTLFCRVVEKLTGIRPLLTKRLLFDPAGEGLAVLCRSVDLPKSQFLAIYKIAARAQSPNAERWARDSQRLDDFYERIPFDVARVVITRWRCDSDYLAVLRAIEQAKAMWRPRPLQARQ